MIGLLVIVIPYVLLGLVIIYLIGFTYMGRDSGPSEPIWAIALPYFTSVFLVS